MPGRGEEGLCLDAGAGKNPKGEPIKADRVDFGDGSIRYLFKNRTKQIGPGWKLEYRTPGPMREIIVPFALKEIRLP